MQPPLDEPTHRIVLSELQRAPIALPRFVAMAEPTEDVGASEVERGVVCNVSVRSRSARSFSASRGRKPSQLVQKLLERKIIASTSPHAVSYARLALGLMNTPEEVDQAVAAVRAAAVA